MDRTIRIIRPFTIFHISRLENWLEEQSAVGYKLIRMNGWSFTFQECSAKRRKYFVYKSPLFLKNDKYLSEFNMAKRRYSMRKSVLNKLECDVFEVDIGKIDHFYKFYYFSRTRHYLKYHGNALIVKMFYFILGLILSIIDIRILSFASILGVSAGYSLVSIITLKYNLAQLKKQEIV